MMQLKCSRCLLKAVGFTLIELLCAIAVCLILITFLFPAIMGMRNRALAIDDAANLRALQTAWKLWSVDNNNMVLVGYAPYGKQGVQSQSQLHWPGRLAPYMDINFLPGEFSVYLDTPGLPEKNPLRNAALPEPPAPGLPNSRKMPSYAINIDGLGTWFTARTQWGRRVDGTELDTETQMHDLSDKTIIFATCGNSWHLGERLPANVFEKPFKKSSISVSSYLPGVNLSTFWDSGKAIFVRADGSIFSSTSVPPRDEWLLP